MKIGDRVCCDQGVGHIEALDGIFADVRWLTPNNDPSCCVGTVWLRDLKVVGENVVPMPKNAKWWERSREFCSSIENITLYELMP